MEMGPGKKGLSSGLHHRRRSRIAASACRPTTSTSTSRTSDDPDTPLEETLEAFGELIKQGKVRAIGASNYSAERLAEALEVSSARTACRATRASSRTTTSSNAPGSRSDLEPLCLQGEGSA